MCRPRSVFWRGLGKAIINGTLSWLTLQRFNKVGNREMYMNCAVVDIVGASAGAGEYTEEYEKRDTNDAQSAEGTSAAAQAALAHLPDLYVANLAGINDCKVQETTDAFFVDPGLDVAYGDGLSASAEIGHSSSGVRCTGVGRKSAGDASSSSSSSSSSGGSSGGDDGQWHGGDSSHNTESTDGSGSSKPPYCGDGRWHEDCVGQPPQDSSSAKGTDGSDATPSSEDTDSQSPISNDPPSSEAHSEVEQELDQYLEGIDHDESSNDAAEEETSTSAQDRTKPGEFYNLDEGTDYDYSESFDTSFQHKLTSRQVSEEDEPTAAPDAESFSPEPEPDVDDESIDSGDLMDPAELEDPEELPTLEDYAPFADTPDADVLADFPDDFYNVNRLDTHRHQQQGGEGSYCTSAEPVTRWVKPPPEWYFSHTRPPRPEPTSDSSDSSDDECDHPVWKCRGCRFPDRCVKINRCTRTCTHHPYTTRMSFLFSIKPRRS